MVPATRFCGKNASSHDATSPCDLLLGLVAGTSHIVCADLKGCRKYSAHAIYMQRKCRVKCEKDVTYENYRNSVSRIQSSNDGESIQRIYKSA